MHLIASFLFSRTLCHYSAGEVCVLTAHLSWQPLLHIPFTKVGSASCKLQAVLPRLYFLQRPTSHFPYHHPFSSS